MRKNMPSGIMGPTSAHQEKTNASRNKRRKKDPVTSRHFSKVLKFSFQFDTSHAATNGTKKEGAKRHRKATGDLRPKITGNKEDEIGTYSIFSNDDSTRSIASPDSTSDYFLRSPSSAYGSVVSLGPLVYTWMSRSTYQDISSKCSQLSSQSESMRNVCKTCVKILREDAFLHFRACPIFQKELDAGISNQKFTSEKSTSIRRKDKKSVCVEQVGQWAEAHLLRHLCPNQCYLRAFAPSREWMLLRKKLKKLVPIDEVLNDWTCRLVHEMEPNQDSSSSRTRKEENAISKSAKLLPVQLPRIEFVSLKSRKSFLSFEKARSSILGERDILNKNYGQIFTLSTCEQFTTDEKKHEVTSKSVESPFGLLEELFPEDPWRVLICTMLLNKTQRKQNLDGTLFHIFQKWPTAESVVQDAANNEEAVRLFVFALVRPAGLGRSKAKAFVQLSRDYVALLARKNYLIDTLQDLETIAAKNRGDRKGVEFELTRTEVKQLFNCGNYAADAYQIFIRKDFESPLYSNDQMLLSYVGWKRSLRSNNEHCI